MKDNRHALQPGTRLRGAENEYVIEKVLGSGSFGITYLATTLVEFSGSLGKISTTVKVAIKEFFMEDHNGRSGTAVTYSGAGELYSKYRTKFEKEATNLSLLKHPNIVKVLELFQANNTFYYAMEYLDGGSLESLVRKRGHLPEDEACRFLRQIASALSFMHSRNMLHLDVKPDNIMLDSKANAVVIDFGISKQYDKDGSPETKTAIGAGTPGYAPVEQMDYHEKNGLPVTMDVYALGATLFRMLTGQRPPLASDVISNGLPLGELQRRGVSRNCIDCIKKAMEVKPADRFSSVDEFCNSLIPQQTEATAVDCDTSFDCNTCYDSNDGVTAFSADEADNTDYKVPDDGIKDDTSIDAEKVQDSSAALSGDAGNNRSPKKQLTYSFASIATGWIIAFLALFAFGLNELIWGDYMLEFFMFNSFNIHLTFIWLMIAFAGSVIMFFAINYLYHVVYPVLIKCLGVLTYFIFTIPVTGQIVSNFEIYLPYIFAGSMLLGYVFMVNVKDSAAEPAPAKYKVSTLFAGIVISSIFLFITLIHQLFFALPVLALLAIITFFSVLVLDKLLKTVSALYLVRSALLLISILCIPLLSKFPFFSPYISIYLAILTGYSFMLSVKYIRKQENAE